MSNICLYLMAGRSERTKTSLPKQFVTINNHEIFYYALKTIDNVNEIDKIIIITLPEYFSEVKKIILKEKFYHKDNFYFVSGGNSRQESVFNGLKYLKDNNLVKDDDNILVHDSSRALVSEKTIKDNLEALKTNFASTTYSSSINSIALSDENNNLIKYIDRNRVINIETPQCIKFDLLFNSHKTAEKLKKIYTDDISILEIDLKKVKLIKSNTMNFKVTTFEDLIILDRLTNL